MGNNDKDGCSAKQLSEFASSGTNNETIELSNQLNCDRIDAGHSELIKLIQVLSRKIHIMGKNIFEMSSKMDQMNKDISGRFENFSKEVYERFKNISTNISYRF